MNALVGKAKSLSPKTRGGRCYGFRSVIEAAPSHNLAGNPAVVPPSGSKVNAVGGSVIPANGRPDFLGDMASTLARVRRVTRGASGRTAVELGGGSNLRSLTATGSVTRLERFGAAPKAVRYGRPVKSGLGSTGRMADFVVVGLTGPGETK